MVIPTFLGKASSNKTPHHNDELANTAIRNMYLPSAKITVQDFCLIRRLLSSAAQNLTILGVAHSPLAFRLFTFYIWLFCVLFFCLITVVLRCRVIWRDVLVFWLCGKSVYCSIPMQYTDTNIDKYNDRRIAQKTRITHTHSCMHTCIRILMGIHRRTCACVCRVYIYTHAHSTRMHLCVRLISRFVFHYLNV